ncbi:TrmH family RNA methyltransferase [Cognatitamlana onchidii]|uniref:TrmH family RNA methyltransferase n=1 Tax=Cognatitamlana onchidii TaxID=2562860 RepID=UPI0010A5CAD7|nr:TrmH family RNA methyltransferase [Algibacter onchidii]
MQLDHYNTKFKKKTFPITVVCDQVSNAPNIGSLFRIVDAFGIENIIFCGKGVNLNRKTAKTSRATEKVVNYELNKEALEVTHSLIKDGYKIIALEITKNSKPLHNFKVYKDTPHALLIGDENFGISDELLKLADDIIHIDMYGQNSSMNVVQATNVALYELTKQFLKK